MPILLQGVSDIGQGGAAEGVDQESIGRQYGAMQPGGSSSAHMGLPTIDRRQLQCNQLLKLHGPAQEIPLPSTTRPLSALPR